MRAAASGDAYRFNAERRAYGDGGQSFILERQLANLKSALVQTPLTILDHRLSAAQVPVMDMRSPAPPRHDTDSSAGTRPSIPEINLVAIHVQSQPRPRAGSRR